MLDSSVIHADARAARCFESPVESVRAVLERPDHELDYARAKIAFDRLVDPSVDEDWVLSELDQMRRTALELAGPSPDEVAKLNALRRLIYKSGPWNGWRPFSYDFSNYRSRNVRLKLLSNYLETRLGNCVSMPILFLILANKLGLDIRLARAPSHLFVRHHAPNGQMTNLETTSGAKPARDIWICHSRGVGQRGISTGFYMCSLGRREGLGAMALIVVEHLRERRRFHEAIAVARVISFNDPTDGFSHAHQGQAYFEIIKTEFLNKYGSPFLIPSALKGQYWVLVQRNQDAFKAAHELGWKPDTPPIRPHV